MVTTARNQCCERCYNQHTAVDDARGVVLDVAVTNGEVDEGETIEAQLDEVCRISGCEIGTVTPTPNTPMPRPKPVSSGAESIR